MGCRRGGMGLADVQQTERSHGEARECRHQGLDMNGDQEGNYMSSMTWWNCLFKGVGWILASVAGLIWLRTALHLVAWEALSVADYGGFFRALYLGAWALIVCLVGLAIIPAWIIVRAKITCRRDRS